MPGLVVWIAPLGILYEGTVIESVDSGVHTNWRPARGCRTEISVEGFRLR